MSEKVTEAVSDVLGSKPDSYEPEVKVSPKPNSVEKRDAGAPPTEDATKYRNDTGGHFMIGHYFFEPGEEIWIVDRVCNEKQKKAFTRASDAGQLTPTAVVQG